MSATAYK